MHKILRIQISYIQIQERTTIRILHVRLLLRSILLLTKVC